MLFVSASLIAGSVEATNTVSRPVGFVRLTVTSNTSILASIPFEAFDASIQGIIGTQLTGATNEDSADRILKWNVSTQQYTYAYFADGTGEGDKDGIWFEDFTTWATSTLMIDPGEGFWIESRQAGTQAVYLAGHVILDASNSVTLYSALSLFSYPFSSKIALNETDLANDGAFGALAMTNADTITRVTTYTNFWLLDDTNSADHLKWLDENSVRAIEEMTLGRGYWYNRRTTNEFTWSETRPYLNPFPSDTNAPFIGDITFNTAGDEATLWVTALGISGELLEVYYKDLGATNAFDSANGWSVAAIDISSSNSTDVTWLDDGSNGRGSVDSVFARFYLVGRGDIDTDGDGASDALEEYVHHTSPTNANNSPYGGVAWSVPGLLEAESFDLGSEGIAYHDATAGNSGDAGYRTDEDVDIYNNASALGGMMVYFDYSYAEWIEYTINVETSGLYDVALNMAQRVIGNTFRLYVDGTNVSGDVAVPETGSWQMMGISVVEDVSLSAGEHVLKFESVSRYVSLDWLDVRTAGTIGPEEKKPYGGVTNTVPMKIEAENYDTGGPGVSYRENTVGNQGDAGFRTNEHVEIYNNASSVGGMMVYFDYTYGEWTEYTINVETAGLYDVALSMAPDIAGKSVKLYVDGTNVSGDVVVPETGNWLAMGITVVEDVSLSVGEHVLRFESPNRNISLDWLDVRTAGTIGPEEKKPYGGVTNTVPMKIEAENYDTGGPGVSYKESTIGNKGDAGFRTNEYVDIYNNASALGGMMVYFDYSYAEWIEYTINVETSGLYDVALNMAQRVIGNTFRLYVDGTNVSGDVSVPETGSWQMMGISVVEDVSLSAGEHVLKFESVSRYVSLDWLDVRTAGTIGPEEKKPYGGVTNTVPMKIEAENYDTGGPGVSYRENTVGNQGDAGFRTNEHVEIYNNASSVGGMMVYFDYTYGEWTEYTINVETAGLYDVALSMAPSAAGKIIRLFVDGTNVSGDVMAPLTGHWQIMGITVLEDIALTSGEHVLRFESPSRYISLDWLDVRIAGAAGPEEQKSYGGVTNTVPVTIEAENYDEGGAAVSYVDSSAGNGGDAGYRTNDHVDVYTNASENALYVDVDNSAEWLEYTFHVTQSDVYKVELRVGTGNVDNRKLKIVIDGTNSTGDIVLPNTGVWTSYQTVTTSNLFVSAGIHTMRVEAVVSSYALDSISILSTNDTDADGLLDSWEQQIIDDNPSDGIVTIGDVLPGDDYDGDGWTNLQEYQRSSDPTEADNYPYGGTLWPVPGLIHAEDYDEGGPSVAYYDSIVGNAGGLYRTDEDVDVYTNSYDGGYAAYLDAAGEWLEFSVNVQTADTYDIGFYLAAPLSGRTLRVFVDGTNVTGDVEVPQTGYYTIYGHVLAPSVFFSGGEHIVRVEAPTGVVRLDYFEVGLPGTVGGDPQGSYNGVTNTPPMLVEAEDFDLGGAGRAYYDFTSGNDGDIYRPNDHVDIYTNAYDVGQGYSVVCNNSGEWLEYTVQIETTGVYDLSLRVSTWQTGKAVSVHVDGTNLTGTVELFDVGNGEIWQSYVITGLTLNAGQRVVSIHNEQDVFYLNYFQIGAPGTLVDEEKGPYQGSNSIPGRIQAEDFDMGGPAVGYMDRYRGNGGDTYRTNANEHVDVFTNAATGGEGYFVQMDNVGEWMEYTLNVETSGVLDLALRVATSSDSGQHIKLYLDGADVSGAAPLPFTDDWRLFQTLLIEDISFSTGTHTLRVECVTNYYSIDWIDIGPEGTVGPEEKGAYGGVPWVIPGRIEGEDYDTGQQNLGYHDNAPGKSGTHYRPLDDVQINTNTVTTGLFVQVDGDGEWLEYTVDVDATGHYDLDMRIATHYVTGRTLQVYADSVLVVSNLVLPNTEGYQSFQTVTVEDIALTAGVQIIRLEGVVAAFSVDYMDFTSTGGDSDSDGMTDTWEQQIIDDNPGDGIVDLDDVLPGDDYDGDGVSNLDEFLRGTDPTDDQDANIIFYVDSAIGLDTYDGFTPTITNDHGPKLTINAALTNALSGDSVQVEAGTYQDDVLEPGANTLNLIPNGSIIVE